MAGFVHGVLVGANWAVLAYFGLVSVFYLVLAAGAAWDLRWHTLEISGEARHRVLSSEIAPLVSVLVPAHNEASTVEASVRALLTLAYPNLEVVVVDDGSTDETMQVLSSAFDLTPIHPIYRRQIATAAVRGIHRSLRFPGLLVASKDNGGKADTLNVALSLAHGELVCAIDADTIIEVDALQRLVRPFLRSASIVAAGATIRVANGCTVRNGRVVANAVPHQPLPGLQAVEYLRAFLFGRVGWNRLGGNLVISGAFGLFRRESLLAIGGYRRTVGEDMELIVRLRRHGYQTDSAHRVEFVPDPVAWTEAPERLGVLGRQRNRWHRGLTDVLWRHRDLLFNPRYGTLGLVAMPAFTLIEWLAPVLEATGLVALAAGLLLGAVNVTFALLFFLFAYGFGLALSCVALMLEELSFRGYGGVRDRLLMLAWAVLENFGYRQLTVWWRLRGIVGFLRGRTDWGAMERRGFTEGQQATPSVSAG